MGRPPRAVKRVPVLVRFEPEVLAWLDGWKAGGATRADRITGLIVGAMADDIKKPADTPPPKPSLAARAGLIKSAPGRLTMADVRPPPKAGARLKKR